MFRGEPRSLRQGPAPIEALISHVDDGHILGKCGGPQGLVSSKRLEGESGGASADIRSF